mmetsp:Transcript_12184/g.18407  ORF Transcript_12184/g.18407 Transcript_12184/m.18407 type:complete len:109 (-) Transcript_12184:187-513(-)|eukprot:CAMPEP_0185025590 /NCGR_PEP_ID=MMETSP1103-20130426/8492_1 /TAXON_ID=36769 /ORGANISM="Paraphysomonas bandaiensis, Strain Caron Lab Isolate" /LENGTH=108 /DNA_ID=CAMNT_0027558827 /DNA_START=18 /DNA_END=344 /DNA_ORIENTATION=+
MAETKATEKKQVGEHSFTADQQNWEQRVKTELESSKKWNEHWGTLFAGNVPNDYKERVEFLEEELKKQKASGESFSQCRYGVGSAFKEVTVGNKDYRRKKFFVDDVDC